MNQFVEFVCDVIEFNVMDETVTICDDINVYEIPYKKFKNFDSLDIDDRSVFIEKDFADSEEIDYQKH